MVKLFIYCTEMDKIKIILSRDILQVRPLGINELCCPRNLKDLIKKKKKSYCPYGP
jgi:hypothetical protein